MSRALLVAKTSQCKIQCKLRLKQLQSKYLKADMKFEANKEYMENQAPYNIKILLAVFSKIIGLMLYLSPSVTYFSHSTEISTCP